MASKTNYSVVIDVGTSKLASLAGRKDEAGKMEILAAAKVPSRGIRRGVVFNIEEAGAAFRELLALLEKQTGSTVPKVDIAYAGQPLKIIEYIASRLTSGDGMVSQPDVDELFKEAEGVQIDDDFRIIHVVPQAYIVDNEPAEFNPVGLTGQQIEVRFKLIAVPESHLLNFRRALSKAGVAMGDVTLSSVAAAESVLTSDEREMGAVLLDVGAGTTKMALFHEGVMMHTAVIPFGGDVVSNDIKEGCCILPKWAEQLKVQFGQALGDFADERKVVTIPGQHGWEPKEISFKSLAFIIQARMEEIIDGVNFQIGKSEMASQLGSGIVLCGGATELHNLISLVKFRTGMDARLAFPVFKPANGVEGLDDPAYLTALGLMQQTLDKTDPLPARKIKKEKKKKRESRFSPWLKGVVQGVLDYVDDDNDVALN